MSKVEIEFKKENRNMRTFTTPIYFEHDNFLFVLLEEDDRENDGKLYKVCGVETGAIEDQWTFNNFNDFYDHFESANFKNVKIIVSPVLY